MRGVALPVLTSALLLAAGCLAGCGGGGPPYGITVTGSVGERPTVTIPSRPPKRELAVRTLHEGKGPKVADGDLVVANYVGYRWAGGRHKLIANSYDAGRPARFPYGRLLAGLNRALDGRRAGSRVVAVIPPNQGYGAAGYPQMQIGGTDSLVFVLDLIATYHNSASASGQAQPQDDPRLPRVNAAGPPTAKVPAAKPPGKLQIKTVVMGSGPAVAPHQVVVFHDVGQVWRDGRVFESTRARGRPDSTVVGARQMLAGWDRAVVGRPVGSRVLAVVPPRDGYANRGHARSGIRPGDTLVFVIDILAAY